jgi:hypothetical protein
MKLPVGRSLVLKNSDRRQRPRLHAKKFSDFARQVGLIRVAEVGSNHSEGTSGANRRVRGPHPLDTKKRLRGKAKPSSTRALECPLARSTPRQPQRTGRDTRLLDEVGNDVRLLCVRFQGMHDECFEIIGAVDRALLGGPENAGAFHQGRSKPRTQSNADVKITRINDGMMSVCDGRVHEGGDPVSARAYDEVEAPIGRYQQGS